MTEIHDVLIVGAGAAGLYVAKRLGERGYRIIIVEAGPDAAAIDVEGSPHQGATSGWATGIGGTTQLWGGQLWPWDREDFQGSPAREIPAWPEDLRGLEHEYQRVFQTLGLPRAHARVHFRQMLPNVIQGQPPGSYRVKYSTWLSWSKRNFGRALARTLKQPNVDVQVNCVATDVVVEGGRAVGCLVRVGGETRQLRALTTIVCAGTLGNVDLISRATSLDTVGRGFMDHVSARVAQFRVVDAKRFETTFGSRFAGRVLCSPRLLMASPDERTLRGFAHWETALVADGRLHRLREMMRVRQGARSGGRPIAAAIQLAVSSLPLVLAVGWARGVRRRRYVPPGATVFLRVDVEQPPRWNSRISRVAETGQLRVEWKIGVEERQAICRHATELLDHLDPAGAGLALVERIGADDLELHDTYHMMGGTSFMTPGSEGVVSIDGAVHGVERLYVCGASNFVSGGLANPTLTALALSEKTIDAVTRGVLK